MKFTFKIDLSVTAEDGVTHDGAVQIAVEAESLAGATRKFIDGLTLACNGKCATLEQAIDLDTRLSDVETLDAHYP